MPVSQDIRPRNNRALDLITVNYAQPMRFKGQLVTRPFVLNAGLIHTEPGEIVSRNRARTTLISARSKVGVEVFAVIDHRLPNVMFTQDKSGRVQQVPLTADADRLEIDGPLPGTSYTIETVAEVERFAAPEKCSGIEATYVAGEAFVAVGDSLAGVTHTQRARGVRAVVPVGAHAALA